MYNKSREKEEKVRKCSWLVENVACNLKQTRQSCRACCVADRSLSLPMKSVENVNSLRLRMGSSIFSH